MAPRSANRDSALSANRRRARYLIAGCLVDTVAEVSGSRVAAARALGVAEKTVRNWINRKRPVNVEVVLAAPRIGPRFRELLCVHAHEEFPYVARKRGPK